MYIHNSDTFEGNSGDGNTEHSVPLVVAGSASVFVRARDANAHNPFVQTNVQSMPVMPSGIQEIPPTGVVGGAGVFAAPVV